jgi:hypothetical protein
MSMKSSKFTNALGQGYTFLLDIQSLLEMLTTGSMGTPFGANPPKREEDCCCCCPMPPDGLLGPPVPEEVEA